MADKNYMLHTLCGQTHNRIYNKLETWTFEKNEVNCKNCLYYLKTIKRNMLYNLL